MGPIFFTVFYFFHSYLCVCIYTHTECVYLKCKVFVDSPPTLKVWLEAVLTRNRNWFVADNMSQDQPGIPVCMAGVYIMPFAVSDLLSSSEKWFELHSSAESEKDLKTFFTLKYKRIQFFWLCLYWNLKVGRFLFCFFFFPNKEFLCGQGEACTFCHKLIYIQRCKGQREHYDTQPLFLRAQRLSK